MHSHHEDFPGFEGELVFSYLLVLWWYATVKRKQKGPVLWTRVICLSVYIYTTYRQTWKRLITCHPKLSQEPGQHKRFFVHYTQKQNYGLRVQNLNDQIMTKYTQTNKLAPLPWKRKPAAANFTFSLSSPVLEPAPQRVRTADTRFLP